MTTNKQNKTNKCYTNWNSGDACLPVFVHSEQRTLQSLVIELQSGQRLFKNLKSKCSDQGAWPNAFTQSLVTFALVTMIVSLCNLVLHWEADEKLHTERRKGFRWKLMITRRELGCQPYREGGEQLIKVTQKADVLVQKAENIWGHLVQGQPCLSICISPQCPFVILHFHKAWARRLALNP